MQIAWKARKWLEGHCHMDLRIMMAHGSDDGQGLVRAGRSSYRAVSGL
jgi:hypothetical protein